MPLDKAQKEIVSWYVHRAYYNCRQAQTLFNTFNNVESIIASFEAIEFSIKAMCKLTDISYAPKHFGADTAQTISILAEKVGESHLYSKDKILQTMPIVMSYSDDLRIISSARALTAGMDTSGEKEADLFAKALNNFCAWFSKQL